jgi:hypothetical protein
MNSRAALLLVLLFEGCATSKWQTGGPPIDLAARRQAHLQAHPSEAPRDIAVNITARFEQPPELRPDPQWAAVLVDGELLDEPDTLLSAGEHAVEVVLGYPPVGPDGRLREVSARREFVVTAVGKQVFEVVAQVAASGESTSTALGLRAILTEAPRREGLGPPHIRPRRLASTHLELVTENASERKMRAATVVVRCTADGSVQSIGLPTRESPTNAGRILGAVRHWRYQPPGNEPEGFLVVDFVMRER